MSLSGSEISNPTISESLPISELINLIKHSFRERDFNEVQNILMDREKNMKMEMENLIRDRDSVKEEVCLLERTHALEDLEKLKIEEKLQMSERKCEQLQETITRLIEEKRVLSDREKRAEERCDKLSAENSKIANEKNKLIFELNEKINDLKSKNLESERLVGVYQEKCKCLDTRVVKMGQEIEDLKREKLAAMQTVEELKLKQMEADQVMEELKRKNVEANQTIDELRLKKLESEKSAQFNKSGLENLEPRIMKIEEQLADMLNVKVGDLGNLVDEMCKLAAPEEAGNLDFQDFKGKKEGSGNGSTQGDAENVVVVSPGVHSTSNSTGSRCIGLSKTGDRNSVQPRAREDIADTVKISSGSRSGYNPPQAESNRTVHDNERKEPHGSGARASGVRSSNKMACSSFATGDIIEIIDSDDETNPSGEAHVSNRGVSGETEKIFEKFVQSPSSSRTNKRNRTDVREDFPTSKKKKSTCTNDEDDVTIHEKEKSTREERIDCSSSRRREEKEFNGLNDGNSTDSENESCSDSRMDDLVASLRSNKLRRKWMFEADMLQAFHKDEELCLNAVCALYRQQVFAGKSTKRSNSFRNGVFSPVDSMSGRYLAEYLIDGDKELRLRKSVAEVKKQRPEVIKECKKLAIFYQEKLYEIYCEEKDPFFGQT